MENQHRKIKGYRELTQAEIDLMNEIKEKGLELQELVDKIAQVDEFGDPPLVQSESLRWVRIGQDHLQQGLMALTRSVAKPLFF